MKKFYKKIRLKIILFYLQHILPEQEKVIIIEDDNISNQTTHES
jgi:hypothetical protein